MKKKVLFLTSSRADYGKIKPLLRALETDELFELHLFVTGMHNLNQFGNTNRYIAQDGYRNIKIFNNQEESMDRVLAKTILGFSEYVKEIFPDMIVVHGDRVEALAGAIVSSFHNIKTLHIEGGEVSGSIDESIRHAVTKLSHYHFVANGDARKRVVQLGEQDQYIYEIGSPDIDIMISNKLPLLKNVLKKHDISFTNFAIHLYHPVTTVEKKSLMDKIQTVMQALISSNQEYLVIYPNNDFGSDVIIQEYKKYHDHPRLKFFNSIQFEEFLTLLKNCMFIIGNSSAGIREASVYGVPVVDIGNRQQGRYDSSFHNILHVEEDKDQICRAIQIASKMKRKCRYYFGDGQSTKKFISLLKSQVMWGKAYNKIFVDFHNYCSRKRRTANV